MDFTKQSDASVPAILDDQFADVTTAFKNSGILTSELLIRSAESLARSTGISEDRVRKFVAQYKQECWSVMDQDKTLQNSYENSMKKDAHVSFTTGDDELDSCLNGGIPCGYLIEVSGSSSTGKSNLLMSLAATIQLPVEFGGLGKSVFEKEKHQTVKTMYISTESSLSTRRLEQIMNYYRDLMQGNGIEDPEMLPSMENVLTTSFPIADLESQDRCLFYQLPAMLERDPGIKLVVIDSITHHVRAERRFWDRDTYITQTCTFLKQLSLKHGITIIVSNQMTDKPPTGIFSSRNDVLYKMNVDYQMSWLVGWNDLGVIYRQLMIRRRKKRPWEIKTGEEAVIDSYDGIRYPEEQADGDEEATNEHVDDANGTSISVKEQLRSERRQLFESKYKRELSHIRTIPALGMPLLNVIDCRIMLRKRSIPILNEDLIDEFSVDLGIDTSALRSSESASQTQEDAKDGQKQSSFADMLASNEYLAHNFETERFMDVVFSPLVASGLRKVCKFEIWKGGIRHG